jgi:pimeloyl-ACP methyl ester carboxylesterase
MESNLNTVTIAGSRVELVRRGKGRPLLFLHPHIGLERASAFLDALSQHWEVFAPSHPGFGNTVRPKGLATIDDISYFYLEFIEQLDLREVVLVGSSLGAWIALGMMIKSAARLSRAVLIDAVGVKFGARDKLDIVDLYGIPEKKFVELAYHDASLAQRDYAAMSDAELTVIAQNTESTARFAWSPYMYDPRLGHLLYRVSTPTLILWGSSDRFAPGSYGRHYAGAIRGATFQEIHAAGHFPHIEQAQATAAAVTAFGTSAHAAKKKESA